MATKRKEEPYLRFMRQSTLPIPCDSAVKCAYRSYKTSLETKTLLSERAQTLRADAFIEPDGLGPLAVLCVNKLAETTTQENMIDVVRDNPHYLKFYNEKISVDLPLAQCYMIDDENYWQRVVSAKTRDKSLVHTVTEWKNRGITLKLEEFIESLPAEFYSEEDIHSLASKIRHFVRDLHLSHLKPITDKTFFNALRPKGASDTESSTTSDSESSSLSSSTELSEEAEEAEEEEDHEMVEHEEGEDDEEEREGKDEREEEGKEEGNEETNEEGRLHRSSKKDAIFLEKITAKILQKHMSVEETNLLLKEAIKKAEARKQLRALRKEKRERRQKRNEKRLLQEAEKKRLEEEMMIMAAKKKKLARKKANKTQNMLKNKNSKNDDKRFTSIFLYDVTPPEENIFSDVCDERNLEEYSQLKRSLRHVDISEICTHYNLRFVRFFTLLESFSLEFAGLKDSAQYNERDFLYSTKDMERLAYSIGFLHHLKTFRFRNSRTSAAKLFILTTALKELTTIETVDFRGNFLEDDCADSIYELFQKTDTIKSLELGYNYLRKNTLQRLAEALKQYKGCLEFLGLDGNPLGREALHILNETILPTRHIKELSLRCVSLSESVITCCIARELIRSHAALRRLNLSSSTIGPSAATELYEALNSNFHITHLDVHDCGLSQGRELAIQILVNRNIYTSTNSVVDKTGNIVGVDNSTQVKHPILARAKENVAKRAACSTNRPNEQRFSHLLENVTETVAPRYTSEYSLNYNISADNTETLYNDQSMQEISWGMTTKKASVAFDASNFDEETVMNCTHFSDRSLFKYLRDKRGSMKYDVSISE